MKTLVIIPTKLVEKSELVKWSNSKKFKTVLFIDDWINLDAKIKFISQTEKGYLCLIDFFELDKKNHTNLLELDYCESSNVCVLNKTHEITYFYFSRKKNDLTCRI